MYQKLKFFPSEMIFYEFDGSYIEHVRYDPYCSLNLSRSLAPTAYFRVKLALLLSSCIRLLPGMKQLLMKQLLLLRLV